MKKFLAPHPLLDCVERLQRLSSGNFLFSTRVEVESSDDNVYDFEIRKWEYGNLIATMRGSLVDKDEQTTGVIYKVEYNLKFSIVLSLYFAGLIFAMVSDFINQRYQQLPVLGLFNLWGLLVVAWMDYLIRRFVKSVKHALI
jgi:hypothetical protein